MMQFVRAGWIRWVAGMALLSGCATIASPDGGARDLVPPELVSTNPEQGARNVTTQTIRLEFSEEVQLQDLAKNLIVAPLIPDENHYKVREDRTAISLIYDKPFAPNTTYSFNFGDAVVDITEKNKAKNVRLAFSTGPQLDSGMVRGVVTDLLTTKPAENASVMLYPANDTAFSVRKGRPYYLTRTDKSGAFTLENLKAGPYRLYALVDKNQSFRYEDGEKIAYLPEPIQVGETLDSVRLQLVRPDARRALITGQQPEPTRFKVSFNEGVSRARLAPLPGTAARPDTATLNQGILLAEEGKTLLVFKTPTFTEGRYVLTAADSAGNVGRDTLDVRFQGKEPTRRAVGYAVEGNPQQVYRQGQVRVKFAVPVRIAPDKPFATLTEDSTAAKRPLRLPKDGRLNDTRTELTINLDTKAEKTLVFQFDSTNIQAVTGQSLGFRPLKLGVSEQPASGSLSGTIQTKYTSYEVQVIDQKAQPIAVLKSPKKTFRFDNLPPGTYRLRVLIDANNDGTWQGSDPNLQVPPEPIYLGPVLQPVRAGWDQEEIKLVF
ncbi:hypothetical protein F1C16_17175 [Hymenobacter sp. NBH84]|nr:Ig-like domain-containing domain [Hymenobacter sp. NBH84]QNE41167.1 hypothetical protein F1C16_17175 [Hymenobacter sp. NBH84]